MNSRKCVIFPGKTNIYNSQKIAQIFVKNTEWALSRLNKNKKKEIFSNQKVKINKKG